jgi:hypothetical protein
MAVLKVRVNYDDGRTVEVKVTPAVQIAFEREYAIGLAKASQDMRNEYMYYLAWKGLQLTGQEDNDFDAFVSTIDDVDVDRTEKSDPTASGPSPDSSSK